MDSSIRPLVQKSDSMTWLGSILYVAAGVLGVGSVLMSYGAPIAVVGVPFALLLAGVARIIELLTTFQRRLDAIEDRLARGPA